MWFPFLPIILISQYYRQVTFKLQFCHLPFLYILAQKVKYFTIRCAIIITQCKNFTCKKHFTVLCWVYYKIKFQEVNMIMTNLRVYSTFQHTTHRPAKYNPLYQFAENVHPLSVWAFNLFYLTRWIAESFFIFI